jgi:hypothetical protein
MQRRANWGAIRLHATILLVLPLFLVLAHWQLNRALGGNGLSWFYAVEWPLFAGYALYVWWRLFREERGHASTHQPRSARGRERLAAKDAEADVELAAYNAYLEALRSEDESRQRSSG